MGTIIPTVGRVVYYKTRGSADGVYPSVDVAGIITRVDDSVTGLVSLVIFTPQGLRFETHTPNGQEIGQWDWMPFQKASISNSSSVSSSIEQELVTKTI